MISFYYVDLEYVDYLRRYETKIPHIRYDDNDKFVCGVVLHVNNLDYFAPISSKIHKQQMCTRILNETGDAIATIKFNFMFPAPPETVTMVDISEIRREDPSYANLLQKEYEFCRANEKQIIEKAKKAYSIGHNPNHFLNKHCCDFALLEQKSKDYFIAIMDEAFAQVGE